MPIEFDLGDQDDTVVASALDEYREVFSKTVLASPMRDESPVDPLLVTSSLMDSFSHEEPSAQSHLIAFGKPIMAGPNREKVAVPVREFEETTLVEFPFPELKVQSPSLQAFYLYEWYRLWDVPAAALKPHMGQAWNPCSNPVTLDEVNAPLLKQYPYVVSTKTNGMRVQLMVTRHPSTRSLTILMVDRTMAMYDVGAQMLGAQGEVLADGCILDGELVERTDNKWGFVMFDVIAFGGRPQRYVRSLQTRLEMVWELYIGLQPTVLPNGHVFTWMTKGMYLTKDPLAFDKVMQEERSYATDGLVFTPLFLGIPFETSPFLFKWKPDELHSVDFRLVGHAPVPGKREKWGLELKYKYQGRERNLLQGFWFIGYMFGLGSVGIGDSPALQTILGRWEKEGKGGSCICECKLETLDLEKERMVWTVVRERTDKGEPNSDLTLLGTLKTIMFPMTMSGLKRACRQQE